MERITHSTRLVDANGSGRDGYTEGTPGVTPASVVTASALNSIQEEIARAIEMHGITLDGGDMEQLGALLAAKVAGAASAVDNELPRFHGTDGKVLQGSDLAINDAGDLVYKTAKARVTEIGQLTGLHGGGWKLYGSLFVAAEATAALAVYRIPIRLPVGAVLTRVEAMVKPGTSRPIAAERMSLLIGHTDLNWSTPSSATLTNIGATIRDNGTTNTQVLDTGAIAYTFTGANAAVATFTSGASVSADLIFGLRVYWDDPGPRNY